MIRLAEEKDLKKVMRLKEEAVALMKKDGNNQWNDHYPSKESFLQYIVSNELYVCDENKEIKAMIVITNNQDNWYQQITWTNDESYYVLHRLAVASSCRGKGYAKKMIAYAIEKAKANDIKGIKADTYSSNKRMPALFEQMGFSYVGELFFNHMPKAYKGYEFLLTKKVV